ncbi:hypothetical protein BpHYR1_008427 [Brachionus plicatilis]|uniref:Uncharacterized protein n=1 Tax=Brachionus plicatilis TaxID=10195 RepID=A0A3M7SB58_BRAPC|nr:hypothetical protein BpHYR1_008427 [Brachionus plicatilis]
MNKALSQNSPKYTSFSSFLKIKISKLYATVCSSYHFLKIKFIMQGFTPTKFLMKTDFTLLRNL